MKERLLEVKALKQYFPVWAGVLRRQVGTIKAVDGVDLTVHKGETVGLVGESGCGKTTFARSIIRLIEPTAGEVIFEGRDLLALSQDALTRLRTEIQIVFQNPLLSLNPRKTIADSIAEPLRFHQLVQSEEECQARVAQALEEVGLTADIAQRYPHEFSGGQLQRICIGRAIILRPKLLICDEAVSSLDLSVQGQILNLLSELQSRLGLSYLFIAHDLAVVRHFCDYVSVMYAGKIVEKAPTDELFSHPKNPYTQSLLQAIPRRRDAKTNI